MNRTQLRLIILVALAAFFATVIVLLMRPHDSQSRPETKPKLEVQQTAAPPQDAQQPTDQQVRQEPPEPQKPQPIAPTQPPAQVHVRVEEQPTPTPSENMHARVVADIRALTARLQEYNTRNGAYPTTGQGLRALGNVPTDPWQHPYIFESPSTRNRESYDLFSAGPDGMPDTSDDDWGDDSESANTKE